jgi:hypothetical protein
VLHPWPLALDYDEMERLLLGTAHVLAWARKMRTAGGGFEEFLGELLDAVYKRSGVLIDAPASGQAGGPVPAAGGAASGGAGGSGGARSAAGFDGAIGSNIISSDGSSSGGRQLLRGSASSGGAR